MKKNILFFLIPLALLPVVSFGTVIIDTPSLTSTGNPTEDNSIVKEIDKQNTKDLADFKLQTFKSCEDMNSVLDKYITEYWKNNKNRYQRREILYNIDKVESEKTFAPMEQSVTAGASNKKTDFSKTNTQVQGVDESDIIKTDGSNIYYYNQSEDKVYISNIRDKKIIKIIQIPSQFENPTLYIDETTLSIVASGYRNNTRKTYVALYSINQKNTFSFQKLYSVDGDLTHSRKIGNKLYLISNSSMNIPYYNWKNEEDIHFDIRKYIPRKFEAIRTKSKKNPYTISQKPSADCNSIEYSLPNTETLKKFEFNPSFITVSVVDTKNLFAPTKTKVIAGSNTEIHMSLKNLYLTEQMYSTSRYTCPRNMACIMPRYEQGTNTIIHKMHISDDDIRYQNSNIVPGRPLTQYSMDEHNSYFRILTQTENWSSKSTRKYTGLYILDSNLKLSGKLENLGNNENFKSSRYMGDKLFLVTFRDIDPFFVIDVANPKEPKVLGELKIPGYSTYLHPYDDTHIIGLGYNTSDNGHGGVYNDGLKLDLYEINYDKKCGMKNISREDEKKCEKGDYKGIIARQKQSYTFGGYGSESEALHNPRMFMWDAAKNTLFLPVTLIFNNKEDKYQATDFFDGMMAISITPESIKKQYKIGHIDMNDVHKKRLKKCEPYLKKTETKKCVKLLNGEEYCESENQRRVPEYCFVDAKDGAYIAHDRWNYRKQFVKRALWVGDQIFVFSDTMMTAHNKENGKFEFGQYFDPIKSITAKVFATFNQDK